MGRGMFGWCLLACALSGCDLEAGVTEGGSCVRTSQCQMLLACVDGACTRDLDHVAAQSAVPDLTRDAAGSMMGEVAMDAMVADDAAMSMPPPAPDEDAGN